MSAHTQGPWDTHVTLAGLLKVNKTTVATMADKRLLDAAPELLAALKQMVSKAESLDESWVFDLDAATAAVEKAEGK